MFPCEMARYIAVFSGEARKYGPFGGRRAGKSSGLRHEASDWTPIAQPRIAPSRLASRKSLTKAAASRTQIRARPARLQHFGTFGGHFLAAAAGAGRGGGGGAGRAIWAAGRGGGGGGAARGGGGGGGLVASCG